MIEKEYYGSHKRPQLSAYERRKINTEKIAAVKFEPKYHTPSGYEVVDKITEKEQEWRKKKIKEVHQEKTNIKPVWTPLDQKNEEELWDE